jgi:hypothetical protein
MASASRSLSVLVADAVGTAFVLLLPSSHNDYKWLDFIVAENSGTAVAPFTVDSAMLTKLKLGLGHLISSLFPNTGFLAKSSDSVENFCRKFPVRQLTPCFYCH